VATVDSSASSKDTSFGFLVVFEAGLGLATDLVSVPSPVVGMVSVSSVLLSKPLFFYLSKLKITKDLGLLAGEGFSFSPSVAAGRRCFV
jgi:hypothetical protein